MVRASVMGKPGGHPLRMQPSLRLLPRLQLLLMPACCLPCPMVLLRCRGVGRCAAPLAGHHREPDAREFCLPAARPQFAVSLPPGGPACCPAQALLSWPSASAHPAHSLPCLPLQIVHSNKDAAAVPKDVSFLIVSYNFVQKMVGSLGISGISTSGPGAGASSGQLRLLLEARPPFAFSPTPTLPPPAALATLPACRSCPSASLWSAWTSPTSLKTAQPSAPRPRCPW